MALGVLVVAGSLAYRHWESREMLGNREEMLALLPSEPMAVAFVDLGQFRSSAFLPQLLAWAPSLEVEEEYVKFVQATGFNYERDLDRVALAFKRRDASSTVFAVADGRFNRKKIEEYAGRAGQRFGEKNNLVFALDLKNSGRKTFLTFLRDDRMAWTNDPGYAVLFKQAASFAGKREWEEHYARLSGSALFVVMRKDAATTGMLAQQAPGGFHSPQLATLLSQLEWITIGGKPEGNDLRVVMEGECSTESTIRQLKEFLGGILLLAQAGLNGPQNRKQMDPQLRDAYWGLLKTTEVETVDRGADKSVRVVMDVTPGFLQAVKKAGVGR
jgi:hypothetical protein